MLICEIGLNHLGEKNYANLYLRKIFESSADALTFQIREPEFYKKDWKKFVLPNSYYLGARKAVANKKIKFGIALSDANKIKFFEKIKTDFYKVLSKDFNNSNLLKNLFLTGKKIYISTGMSGQKEIKKFLTKWRRYRSNTTFIHTQLSYDFEDTNLKAIWELKKLTGLPVAFGNHAKNSAILLAAAAFEPSDIFFYVKGDKKHQHPDENHAVRLENLGLTIDNLTVIQIALGSGEKKSMKNLIGQK